MLNVFELMTISIKYYNGEMNIDLQKFFPASNTRLKKLLDVVDLDYKHRDELYNTLTEFCNWKIKGLEECISYSGHKSLDYHQKVADAFAMVESGKHPNGVPLSKVEFKEIKEQHRHYKAVEAAYTSDFKRYTKQKERFLKHLEMLEQRR